MHRSQLLCFINPWFELLESIPHKAFSVYFPQVSLTSESKEILGSGHLFIDEEGYKIKIINSNPPSRDEETKNLLTSMSADTGKWEIRSVADYCYSLKAQDNYGNEYSCDYVDAGSGKLQYLRD